MPPSHRGDSSADHKHRASSKIVDLISSKSLLQKKRNLSTTREDQSTHTHTEVFTFSLLMRSIILRSFLIKTPVPSYMIRLVGMEKIHKYLHIKTCKLLSFYQTLAIRLSSVAFQLLSALEKFKVTITT